MNQKKFDIMVAGHLCVDLIPTFPVQKKLPLSSILSPGKLIHIEGISISTGGAVSNTGLALKKLGHEVAFAAKTGNDELGQITVSLMRKHGNIGGILNSDSVTSSYSVVIALPDIDRIFLHCPGANDDFSSEDVDISLMRKCAHFHFGYPPVMKRMFDNNGEELINIFRKAKEAGMTTSCDMALPDPESPAGKAPWYSILNELLPYVDIFLPSIEEALFMLDKAKFLKLKQKYGNAELVDRLDIKEYESIASQFISMGTSVVALKSGYKGWFLKSGPIKKDSLLANRISEIESWSNRSFWAPSFLQQNFKSATGAGDSSIAGFLSGFLRKFSIEGSLKLAMCMGWQNVRAFDAVSGINSWDETERLMSELKEQVAIKLPPRWKYDRNFGLYVL